MEARCLSWRSGLTRPNMKVNDKEGLGLRISSGLGFPVQGGQISLGFFYDHLSINPLSNAILPDSPSPIRWANV